MPLVASFPLPFFVLTWSSWFSAAVIKRHGQKQLTEEVFIWAYGSSGSPYGGNMAAHRHSGRSRKLREGT